MKADGFKVRSYTKTMLARLYNPDVADGCYILTAIAGENAKIADMEAARKILDETGGKMEKAEQLYVKYLRENKEINYTKKDELPF